jgi:hypothetical protein
MSLNLKMNLDKKSLIQIVVLVLLVAAGAGVVFLQQGGGLDFVTGLFDDKPAGTKGTITRAPTAGKGATGTSEPADNKPKVDVAAIPATPAKGQIHGKPFVVEGSHIENGVLTLNLGKDVRADLDIRIVLFTPVWEVPAGKHFKFTNASGKGLPQVVISWNEAGLDIPREQKFTDKYSLQLEFGAEKNGKLPGKIYLALPDEVKSGVAGTFEADIKGFRLVNGKPDLTADSTDTFQYLVLRELLREDPDKAVEIVAFRDGRYSVPEGKGASMTGYLEAEYRAGQGTAVTQRYQFRKETDGWKVAHVLKANQLDEAHPLAVPGPKDTPERLMTYLAAKKLEAGIQKRSPKKGIYDAAFTVQHNDKHKLGVCEVSYRLEADGKPQKAAYLFRLQPKGWVLDRELGKKEKVDLKSGRVSKG